MDALGWKTPRAQRNTKGAFTPNWLGSIKMDPRVFPRFLWFALVGMKPVSRFNQPDIKSRDTTPFLNSAKVCIITFFRDWWAKITYVKTNCLLTKSTTHYNEQTSPLFRSNRRLPCLERSVHQYSLKWAAKAPLRQASVSCGAHRDRCRSVCPVRFSPFFPPFNCQWTADRKCK